MIWKTWTAGVIIFLLLIVATSCKKASKGSSVIEDVDRKKLEKMIANVEYLAVLFNTKNCKDCGALIEELERITDDAGNFGVAIVKNTEKSTAKKYGVTSFPSLVYFRNQQPAIFEGDLMDEEKVLAWLTDLDSMELPDKIEEVNVKILQNLIEDSDFLAVLIYQDENEDSEKVLQELENIDDEADSKGIGFVKIADENLAIEYGLDTLPALVYYRKQIPLLYDGDLFNEEEVLAWLFEFQDLGEESEAIEDVSANSLVQLIEESPHLAVLFYDIESRRSQRILEELETIDSLTARHGIPFVKIHDQEVEQEYGIESVPQLVYFEHQMPNFYQGDLSREEEVLEWLIKQTESDEIEDVTDRVLQRMIKRTHELAVLFYNNDEASNTLLAEFETLDDGKNFPFVKIKDPELAEAYGITKLPTLVFFENQVPNFYKGNLTITDVENWLTALQSSDEIEAVSDQVIELMLEKCEFLAVLFYDSNDADAIKALSQLENIDDESDKAGIPLVRSESKTIAEMYGIEGSPALVFFEGGVPNTYSGDMNNEEEVLKWLLEQQSTDEIEDVSPKVLEQMIQKSEHLAVLFYDKNDQKSKDVLHELEEIDDEADQEGLPFIRIHTDEELAEEYGFQNELPVLVYFEKRIPSVFQGDLTNEQQVWKWLNLQLTTDGIEEVTDKLLFNLIAHNPFVAVLFYDPKSKKSAKVMKELESIDDDADAYNILLVKNKDPSAAQKYACKKLPALMFFKEGSPTLYEENLMKEENVLQWLIDNLANDEIEDINASTLDQLIESNSFVAVLIYDKASPTSEAVLSQLENIDSETDRHGIPFVRIADDSVAKEFGIEDELPILVYFENKIPSVYEGDLKKYKDVLKWIIKQKEEDTIEEVTDEILEDLLKDHEYILVFFAPDDCKECDKILHELENIDTMTDDHGIIFVTTEDTNIAKKKANLDKLPAVVLFRNGVPVIYKGDLKDEDKLLAWVTSEDALDIPDRIEEVNTRMLNKLLNTSPYVAVLFYQENNAQCDKVLAELENIDTDAEALDIDLVKISDPKIIEEYSIVTFPTLVFFRKRFPQFYEGDLMDEDKALKWLIANKNKKGDVIEHVDKKLLDVILEDVEHVVVFFYEKSCSECDSVINELEKIDENANRQGIHFLKTDDTRVAEDLGIDDFPTLVYFEHSIPSIYSGDMTGQKVLDWLLKEKTEDTIENINREMLFKLIEDQEFLAVFFYAENDKESEDVLSHLEKIDDDCTLYDVHLVKMSDKLIAKKHGVKNPPGIVVFRNGKPIKYTGKLKDEEAVLEWLTSPETLAVNDVIEKVNKIMLPRVLQKFDSVAVLFYAKSGCKQCSKVMEELEKIDDEAAAEGIHIVKIEDRAYAKEMGILAFPAILFFRGADSVPIIYAGDIKNGDRMLDWLRTQKDPNADIIEEINGEDLRKAIATADHLAIFFYDKNLCSNCDKANIDAMECEDCQIILDELENIDDDSKRSGIQFYKTTDLSVAKHYGIKVTPALVYYENQVPSIYEGDLAAEEEVLEWLLHEKSEDTIETVNKAMLEKLIVETEYLAVFFYKPHCRACDIALQELEKIDDDTDLYGIRLVRIYDGQLAKRYGLKTFPAIVYFRNGNPLIYDGDLKNEENVLEWLIDDENRELPNEIETVNSRMLKKLVDESPFLAVFFYGPECADCERALVVLENIDDDVSSVGIDLVKISDPEALSACEVEKIPSLAFFRKGQATYFEGDLYDEEKVKDWLTSSDVFEIKDEIEEVNRKMLDNLLEENEFVAVFFYENNCEKCDEALHELERIDETVDELDVMLVKIKDSRYAKKYGISKMPSLVFFRKKFPSVYRGDLEEEEEVLNWLKTNRHNHPEINVFLYGLGGITFSFVLYTVILVYCRNKEKKE